MPQTEFKFPRNVTKAATELFQQFQKERSLARHPFWVRKPQLDSSGYVWVSQCGGYVAKWSLLCLDGIPCQFAVPTLNISETQPAGYDNRKYRFLLQPKANIPRTNKKREELSERLHHALVSLGYSNHDVHEDNVGYFMRKPVVFDW